MAGIMAPGMAMRRKVGRKDTFIALIIMVFGEIVKFFPITLLFSGNILVRVTYWF
jgi:hypothetical protein